MPCCNDEEHCPIEFYCHGETNDPANATFQHRQPNVMVACAQAHVAQARDCIVVTIQSLACATCACAQATITLGCLWFQGENNGEQNNSSENVASIVFTTL